MEHSAKARGEMLGRARPVWFRVTESEQRMNWLKSMIKKRILVRDIDSFLKSQEVKIRSDEESIREEERDILLGLMDVKLKDEKKNYRRLVRNREDMRKLIKKECENNDKKYLTFMRKIRRETNDRKRELVEKYKKKIEHLGEIRKKEEEKRKYKVEVPEEIKIFKDCVIFDEAKFSAMRKAEIGNLTIGKVKIDDDERAALSLPPNFAILKFLDEEEQERDIELGLSKLRLEARNIEEKNKLGNIEYEASEGKRIRLDCEIESREKEKERELYEAKERQIFNPIEKTFDFSKRRVTDMKECSKIHLPKPLKANEEGELEMIREVLMNEFKKYKREKEEEFEKRREERQKKRRNIFTEEREKNKKRQRKRINEEKIDKRESRENKDMGEEENNGMKEKIENRESKKEKNRNQEGENLTMKEKRGVQKLKERIKEGEIVVLKTDKSGKLVICDKEEYLKMGKSKIVEDRKLERGEIKKIEEKINDHTRMITKIFNIGESHKHLKRVQESVITHSEISAPMYYLYKDHKKEPGWRPVVSGCNSNTVGLSNILSDIIESVCNSISDPYEVISSEDMLYRISKCNKEIREEIEEKKKVDKDWDWREKYLLLGSDVEALFPSLSAQRTARIVREQVTKSKIIWENIDPKWLCLYIHLNREESSGLSEVLHLLPKRTPGRRGKEAGMGSLEAKRREVRESGEGNWVWPETLPTEKETRELIGIAMEIAVKTLF